MDVFGKQPLVEVVAQPRVNAVRLSIVYFGVIGLVSLMGFGVYAWLFSGDGDGDVPTYAGVQKTDIPSAPELSPDDLRTLESAARIQQQFEERGDADRDGLSKEQETAWGTDPDQSDTDADGIDDYTEVMVKKTDPLSGDTDADGIDDYVDERDDRPKL